MFVDFLSPIRWLTRLTTNPEEVVDDTTMTPEHAPKRRTKQKLNPLQHANPRTRMNKKVKMSNEDRDMIYNRTRVQDKIHDWAANLGNNNSVTRQLQQTCAQLLEFDQVTPLNNAGYDLCGTTLPCYGCNKFMTQRTHPVYVFSCHDCGNNFQENRHLTRDLTGQVAVVVGARTKLGHQIVMKLLQAGATVVGTTRFPERALSLYETYPEFKTWKERLLFYPVSFDLDVPDIAGAAAGFARWLPGGVIDILVCCAAQTIRVREKGTSVVALPSTTGEQGTTNRYQDPRFVDSRDVNSWQMRLSDLVQTEMEEVFRINAIAPCLLIQQWEPLLMNSQTNPYIINVHAREGLFTVEKSAKHIHTNMAKAGLAMLTKGLKSTRMKTHDGKAFYIHGCDPGWISVDEYYEETRPWQVPPLDEIDGAARILYPVMLGMEGSYARTRRHFRQLLY